MEEKMSKDESMEEFDPISLLLEGKGRVAKARGMMADLFKRDIMELMESQSDFFVGFVRDMARTLEEKSASPFLSDKQFALLEKIHYVFAGRECFDKYEDYDALMQGFVDWIGTGSKVEHRDVVLSKMYKKGMIRWDVLKKHLAERRR